MTVRRTKTPDESAGWPRSRVMACAIGSVLAPLLLIAVFEATGGRRNRGAETVSPPPELPGRIASAAVPTVVPTASATAVAGPTVAPVAPAAAPDPTPSEIAGKDATAWRHTLRASAETADWKSAADALEALAKLDPEALEDGPLAIASKQVAVAVGNFAPDLAHRAFDALQSTPAGLDVLYDVMSTRGGTKAARQASELLARDEVRARASAALKVTLALREAPCKEKEALFERAVADGDKRTLVLMDAWRSPSCAPEADGCCLKDNATLESAVRRLRARVAPSPASAGVVASAGAGAAAPTPPEALQKGEAAPPPQQPRNPPPVSVDPYD